MDNERWLPVVGFENTYEVSDAGRVRSIPRPTTKGRVLKGQVAGRGYLQVCLSVDGVLHRRYIHRLVAEAFIGPRPPGMEVLHGKSDPTDNRAVNLRYDTHSRNMVQTLIDGTNQYSDRQTCNHGHPWTEATTSVQRSGTYGDGTPKFRRRCKECQRVKASRDYARTRFTL